MAGSLKEPGPDPFKGSGAKRDGGAHTGTPPHSDVQDVGPYQASGPFSAKEFTRKSMKARTLGWVNRPGG